MTPIALSAKAATHAPTVIPAQHWPLLGTVGEIVITALMIIAGIFGLVGSFGLVKLPDPMTRLHAPTTAATLGVGGVLIASMLHSYVFQGVFSWHELLISIFLFLTVPITGNFIAKAHIHLAWSPDELPEPAPGLEWATCSRPDADGAVQTSPDIASDRNAQ